MFEEACNSLIFILPFCFYHTMSVFIFPPASISFPYISIFAHTYICTYILAYTYLCAYIIANICRAPYHSHVVDNLHVYFCVYIFFNICRASIWPYHSHIFEYLHTRTPTLHTASSCLQPQILFAFNSISNVTHWQCRCGVKRQSRYVSSVKLASHWHFTSTLPFDICQYSHFDFSLGTWINCVP